MASTRAGNTIKRVMHLIKQEQGVPGKQEAGENEGGGEKGGGKREGKGKERERNEQAGREDAGRSESVREEDRVCKRNKNELVEGERKGGRRGG